jgi:hypothetical protein
MHQVFYIDLEEEVTSIVDRLKKSKSADNVFVIPIRALILGSTVSLKLIKKKAEEMKRRVVIVTQDEQGRALAEKVGFETKDSLEGIDIHPETISSALNQKEQESESASSMENLRPQDSVSNESEAVGKNKMSDMRPSRSMSGIRMSTSGEKKMDEISVARSENREEVVKDLPRSGSSDKVTVDLGSVNPSNVSSNMPASTTSTKAKMSEKGMDVKKVPHQTKKVSKKLRVISLLFVIFFVFLIGGIFAYMFLPKADIHVYPQRITEKMNISARAQTDIDSIDVENRFIRAKLIKVNDSVILNKESTGEELASNQKARGRIVIYNEFSEESQQLVATTRFESSDGKIFRIVKGVTVPGMKEENGEMIPGSVEADVVADDSGEQYNIGPGKFTIPGFKTSPKYEKFYAKSEKGMLGGGSQGEMVRVVSESDVEGAKKDAEKSLKESIIEKIESTLEEGYILDHDSVGMTVVSSSSFPVQDSVAKSFEYQMEVELSALVFSQKDLITLIQRTVENNAGYSDGGFVLDSIELEYGQVSADFEEELVDMSVHTSISLKKEIDSEKILNGFLGVKLSELGEVVKGYPEVRKVDVVLWPKILVNKIPKNSERVKVYVEDENE